MNDIDTAFRSIPFLQSIDDEGRRALAKHASTHVYPKGNLIYYHGESCSTVYVMVGGRAKISLLSDDGREVVLRRLRRGDVFGLDAALGQMPYFGTCFLQTRAVLSKVPARAFLAWLKEHPDVQEHLLVHLVARLRSAYEKVGAHALMPVRRRLLMTLLEIARTEGVSGPRGELSFVRPTHQDLAAIVGSTRVVVSRLLSQLLKEEKGITVQGDVIQICPDDLPLAIDPGRKR